jgi:hypothetical protein
VRKLIRTGVPERVAKMISSHTIRSILDRYNIVSERDRKDAGRLLGTIWIPKTKFRQNLDTSLIPGCDGEESALSP